MLQYVSIYHRSGNFHVKNFCGVKFSQFVPSSHPQIFFNVWRLQRGRAPGAFIAFSLLPGIGRTGIPCCNAVAGRQLDIYIPPEVWTCVHTYLFIIAAQN